MFSTSHLVRCSMWDNTETAWDTHYRYTATIQTHFLLQPAQFTRLWNQLTINQQTRNWCIRGAIKKFSAWPTSVQNKIKIVSASYSRKAQNMTCTIWLLGYKYFVHFSGRRLFAYDIEKTELSSVMKWQFWLISFIPLHALLFWLRIKVVDACFILNNELWNKFLLGQVDIVRKVLQKLVRILVLAFSTLSDRHCSYAEMHKIFIAQKSYCACRVLSLATIRSKYYFNLFWTELGQAAPRTFWSPLVQYILGDLHILAGKSGLAMYNLFWNDYKTFAYGNLTEYQNV